MAVKKIGRPRSVQSSAPYRLLAILTRFQIAHGDLRKRLLYTDGKCKGNPMSPSSLSLLLSRQQWPKTLDEASAKATVATFLQELGVPEHLIEQAWEIDGYDDSQTSSNNPDDDGERLGGPAPVAAPFELPEAEMLSPAARQHFNLTRHPFVDDVQGPQDVYLSKDQRYIRESMYYAAKHAGLIAIVGESGSGKSTLRRDLVDRIRRDNEPIIVIQPQAIDKKELSATHICDAIIADLSTEPAKQSLEAKARQIQRILASSAKGGNSHCLVIEEAHDLSIHTLKYLKRFWELEDGFKKLIGIIMIGQPELGDRLDERRNYDARELIRRTEVATLRPLNGNLEEYIGLKLKRIGVKLDDIFEADAFDAIRNRLTRRRVGTNEVESHLYPLVVHNLIAKCMNAAVDLGLPKVNAQLVARV
jgi:type II secretory pathway predicted ATPase ExeA